MISIIVGGRQTGRTKQVKENMGLFNFLFEELVMPDAKRRAKIWADTQDTTYTVVESIPLNYDEMSEKEKIQLSKQIR